MNQPNIAQLGRLMLLAGALSTAACTSTAPRPEPAPIRIEVQEAVGFTITEEARVGDNIRLQYGDALALLERGRVDEGIEMLEAVAESAPELSAPRIDLGIAHQREGRLEDAENYLRQALALNPDHPTAHNELGIVLRKTGRFNEARESYEAALAIYPNYHFARRNLAVLCDLYLVDLRCALENYEAYMATVPSDEEASMWIADLRYRMGGTED